METSCNFEWSEKNEFSLVQKDNVKGGFSEPIEI